MFSTTCSCFPKSWQARQPSHKEAFEHTCLDNLSCDICDLHVSAMCSTNSLRGIHYMFVSQSYFRVLVSVVNSIFLHDQRHQVQNYNNDCPIRCPSVAHASRFEYFMKVYCGHWVCSCPRKYWTRTLGSDQFQKLPLSVAREQKPRCMRELTSSMRVKWPLVTAHAQPSILRNYSRSRIVALSSRHWVWWGSFVRNERLGRGEAHGRSHHLGSWILEVLSTETTERPKTS